MLKTLILMCWVAILAISCKPDTGGSLNDNFAGLEASLATKSIDIDGLIDAEWATAVWYPIDQVWLGENLLPQDFSGQYKLKYDKDYLYVLASITDDRLFEQHEDGLYKYWDDDCLEIFVDEDRSKGNHQYNHNAFAYHIALDKKVVDIGTDSTFRYYNDNVKSARRSAGMKHIWEVAVKIYDDGFVDDGDNIPVQLANGKRMGFAIAYCDNDGSAEREHFIGSVMVEGEDKNRGWIDAGIFEELRLK